MVVCDTVWTFNSLVNLWLVFKHFWVTELALVMLSQE